MVYLTFIDVSLLYVGLILLLVHVILSNSCFSSCKKII